MRIMPVEFERPNANFPLANLKFVVVERCIQEFTSLLCEKCYGIQIALMVFSRHQLILHGGITPVTKYEWLIQSAAVNTCKHSLSVLQRVLDGSTCSHLILVQNACRNGCTKSALLHTMPLRSSFRSHCFYLFKNKRRLLYCRQWVISTVANW